MHDFTERYTCRCHWLDERLGAKPVVQTIDFIASVSNIELYQGYPQLF